ncbi:uncharacterized protein LOC130356211 isoform X2 [Hyla sarda]|uniref:uncharacterized protein LOC130356211 isoform X2 n=1 Tax=Hyla sarda TaxID=327740 RepID=UPI0024C27456|nr:uncharacterized protein LOC130356211 isoform X2 [Hyla sarda]
MEAREAMWSSQVGTVFSTDTNVPVDKDFTQLTKEIIEVQRQITQVWWNIKSLEEYARLGIFPRGLRVQIFPALEVTTEFKEVWETGLAKCSVILLDMLVAHDKDLLVNCKSKLQDLETQLLVFDKEKLVGPFQVKLKDMMDKYEKEIMEGKKTKFNRDRDYDRHEVYRWRHRGNRRYWKKGQTNNSVTPPAQPGSSNVSSSDFFINKRHRRRTRRGKRKSKKTRGQTSGTSTSIPEEIQIMEGEVHPSDTAPVDLPENQLQIINLSSYILTETEKSVLARGLSFSPMNSVDRFDLTKDTYLFCRKLVLKLLHSQPSVLDNMEHNDEQIMRDLVDLLEENETGSNLTRQETQAIYKLQKNDEFLIKEADEGGNVVLWPTAMYIKEAMRQLNNSRYYQHLPSDPTEYFQRKYFHILDTAFEFGIISKKEQSFLQPLVTSLLSYIRDSMPPIQMTQDLILPEQTLLVTCDVESLYSNISHKDGVKAVDNFFQQQVSRDREFDVFLLRLLDFVLKHNFFTFDGRYYLQVSGTKMGARCAPSYANLFLGWWEGAHVYPSPYFNKVLRWFRFIDDVFFLWQGSREECLEFISFLNNNDLNIHLTTNISSVSVEFLDIQLTVADGRLETKLFRKLTATNSLLHFTSFHPSHTLSGIPTGQFLRVKRNCSNNQDFREQCNELTSRFNQKGYPKKIISRAYRRAQTTDRKNLLLPNSNTKPKVDETLRFVSTYNNQWGRIKDILTDNWNILLSDARVRAVIPERPLLVSRRAPNLKDLFTRSHFQKPTRQTGTGTRYVGSFPCGNCNICQYMTPTRTFLNPLDGREYKLKKYVNCKSTQVIYAIICPCRKVYIGTPTEAFINYWIG